MPPAAPAALAHQEVRPPQQQQQLLRYPQHTFPRTPTHCSSYLSSYYASRRPKILYLTSTTLEVNMNDIIIGEVVGEVPAADELPIGLSGPDGSEIMVSPPVRASSPRLADEYLSGPPGNADYLAGPPRAASPGPSLKELLDNAAATERFDAFASQTSSKASDMGPRELPSPTLEDKKLFEDPAGMNPRFPEPKPSKSSKTSSSKAPSSAKPKAHAPSAAPVRRSSSSSKGPDPVQSARASAAAAAAFARSEQIEKPETQVDDREQIGPEALGI